MAIDLNIGIPRIDITSRKLAPDQALIHIASGSALFFVGTFFGLGLNYLYTLALARFLGPGQFGLYALGLGMFSLLSVIAVAGLDTAVLRFIPAARAQADTVRVSRTVRATLVLASCFASLLAVAMLFGSNVIAERLFHNSAASLVLLFFALSIPLYVVSSISLAVLQSFGEVRWRTTVKYLCEPVVKFTVTLGLFWAGWGVMSALVAFPIALALTAVLALWPLHHLLTGLSGPGLSKGIYGEMLKYSSPLLGGLLFNSIATRSDILVLGYWVPIEEVGIYSAAFQTSAIMAVILGTFESIATPYLSESISRDDRGQIRSLSGALLRWTLTATFPLFLLITVFAEEIMALFGKDFASGSSCLIILVLGQFVQSAVGCSNGLLLWTGHSKLVMWNSVVTSVVQIGLYFLLIPSYGALGAAVATCTGLVLVVIMRSVQVYRVLNLWPHDRTTLKPMISGLAALLVVVTTRMTFESVHVMLLAGLFAVTYVGFLYVLGLHEGDRAVLLKLRQRFS